ncbi:MAG: ABC transporter ATP-binding protein [Conexivisphaerales archaeon]
MLKINSVSKRFQGVIALDHVSLDVNEGKIYGLIGPNGSGKTTLVNCITGFIKANEGSITFGQHELTNLKPHEIVKKGIVRTFQNTRVFNDLTVEENLVAVRSDLTGSLRLIELLDAFDLNSVKGVKASSLSYGQKKMLEIARALALEPAIILLDEPLAGLDVQMISKLSSQIKYINKSFNKTLLIVEHNLDELMSLADYVFVMNNGVKTAEGEPSIIRNSKIVQDVYFGR